MAHKRSLAEQKRENHIFGSLFALEHVVCYLLWPEVCFFYYNVLLENRDKDPPSGKHSGKRAKFMRKMPKHHVTAQ